MRFSRLITLICAFVLSVSVAFAQSSGDKLYNQGLQLQKTMTKAAQNSAIAKFNSAKKLYDSAAKKAQCDQAIAVSRNIIASLSGNSKVTGTGNKRNGNKDGKTETVEEVKPVLTLSNSEFNLDLNARTITVTVNTNIKDWTVTASACEDGSSFITASKSGDDTVNIRVSENPSTIIREQKVIVSGDGLTREVMVTQTGRRIELDASEKLFNFKEKGGSKKFNVSCNSDYVYEQNSDENWYVESRPSWVKIVLNEKKDKNKVQELGGKVTDKLTSIFKGKNKNDDPTLVKTSVTLSCDHLVPGSIEAHDGRKGEVVIVSGDKKVILYITQLGKASTVR